MNSPRAAAGYQTWQRHPVLGGSCPVFLLPTEVFAPHEAEEKVNEDLKQAMSVYWFLI